MNTLYSILVAIDVLLAIGIIGLILIQHGKGADVGAAFGSGASGTVFGSQGSASFLTRLTAVLATLFFINSLALAYLASNRPLAESVIDSVEQTSTTTENMSDDISTDVPEDIPEDSPSSEEMGEVENSDIPADMPAELDTQSDIAEENSLDELQENVDDVSPNDVPE